MARKLAVQTTFTAHDAVTGVVANMGRHISRFAQNANRAGNAVRSGFGGLRTVIGGIATALVTGAAGKAVADFAQRGDAIARNARILGLSAEAFQEIGYAAKFADLSSEDLTIAFKKMNANMGQLRAGQGGLYTYLKNSNPQLALQLKHTKDSDKAFGMLMDTIAGETDVAKRAALAQAAFGKSGQGLIAMAADLNKKRAEAKASGSLMSDEETASAESLDDALKRIKVTGMGLLNSVLAPIARGLVPIIDGINSWVQANKAFLSQNIGTIFRVIGNVFQQLGPSIVRVIEKLLPAIEKIIDKALPVLVELLDTLLPLLGPLLDLLDPILEIFVALAPALKAVAEMISAILTPALMILKPILQGLAWLVEKVITPIIEFVAKITGGVFGGALKDIAARFGIKGGQDQQRTGVRAGMGDLRALDRIPVSPNTSVISSNSTTTRNVRVGVDFYNPPPGTAIKQKGYAPEITVGLFNTLRGIDMSAGGAH